MTDTTPTNPMATGSYVQYNATTQSPLSPGPSAAEQTIGIVRQLFMSQGKQFAQVVWNPGDANPKTGIYHADQLTALDQQTAQQIRQQIAAGTYQPSTPQSSTDYKSPTL